MPAPLPLAADDGTPDCIVNPAAPQRGFFGFLPWGCMPNVDCTGVRLIVVGFGIAKLMFNKSGTDAPKSF